MYLCVRCTQIEIPKVSVDGSKINSRRLLLLLILFLVFAVSLAMMAFNADADAAL